MLEVRAARHGDAPALDALGAAPEAGVFVLEKNGAVIGALTLRAGEIFGCAVAPEWRGRGYGTFLLRRALRLLSAYHSGRLLAVAPHVGCCFRGPLALAAPLWPGASPGLGGTPAAPALF